VGGEGLGVGRSGTPPFSSFSFVEEREMIQMKEKKAAAPIRNQATGQQRDSAEQRLRSPRQQSSQARQAS
jgi:hypothetical protein